MFSRIAGWEWGISSPSPDFCTSSVRGTLFVTGKGKNPGWAMCKIFPEQQWVFSRIRNERFQGNPRILLAFFTVYNSYIILSKKPVAVKLIQYDRGSIFLTHKVFVLQKAAGNACSCFM
jgi:hypothetical protein